MARIRSRARSVVEWERRLARQVASGQTVARFCAGEGVSVAAFYYQLRKRRGRSAASVSARGAAKRAGTLGTAGTAARSEQCERAAAPSLFRQLRVTSGPAVAHAITLRLPNGAELSFARDPDLVRQVLEQLLCAGSAPSPSGDRSC